MDAKGKFWLVYLNCIVHTTHVQCREKIISFTVVLITSLLNTKIFSLVIHVLLWKNIKCIKPFDGGVVFFILQ